MTSLQRTLIQQVVEQVKEIDRKTAGKAVHSPHGPKLYHVDSQGHVTIWAYQRLSGRPRRDSEEHDVGWGSSQLVDAEGMYYLPDGTPLQSRWRWRTSPRGMTDIRVNIGRPVTKDERVGLIHRHRLSSEFDLYSRDGRERKIMVHAHKNQPWSLMVRVDKPMQLIGWWLGNVESHVQRFEQYDQLIVTGPAGDDNAPMLVTVQSPETSAASAPDKSPVPDRQLQLLEKERDATGKDIDDYELKIRQLEERHGGTMTLEAHQKMMLERVAGLLDTLTQQEAKRLDLETQMKVVYAEEIVRLEKELIALKQTHAPTHPEVERKAAILEAMKKRSKEHVGGSDEVFRLRMELERVRVYEKHFRELIDREDIESVRIGRIVLEITDLENRLKLTRERYAAILSRIEAKTRQSNPVPK